MVQLLFLSSSAEGSWRSFDSPLTELTVSIKNVTSVLSQEGVSVKCRHCQPAVKTVHFLQKICIVGGIQSFVNAQVRAPCSTLFKSHSLALFRLTNCRGFGEHLEHFFHVQAIDIHCLYKTHQTGRQFLKYST